MQAANPYLPQDKYPSTITGSFGEALRLVRSSYSFRIGPLPARNVKVGRLQNISIRKKKYSNLQCTSQIINWLQSPSTLTPLTHVNYQNSLQTFWFLFIQLTRMHATPCGATVCFKSKLAIYIHSFGNEKTKKIFQVHTLKKLGTGPPRLKDFYILFP